MASKRITLAWSFEAPRASIGMSWALASGARSTIAIGSTAPASRRLGVAWTLDHPRQVVGLDIGAAAEAVAVLSMGSTVPASRRIGLAWTLDHPRRVVGLDIGAAAGTRVSLPMGATAPASRRLGVAWTLDYPRRVVGLDIGAAAGTRVSLPMGATAPASRRIGLAWSLTEPARTVRTLGFALLDHTPARTLLTLRWSMPDDVLTLPATMPDLIRQADGRRMPIESVDVDGDEASWGWSISATLADEADWLAITPGDRVSVTVGDTEFAAIVDGHGRQAAPGSVALSVSGRSPTGILADGVGDIGAETAARAAVQSLCDAAGIDLDWRTVDWLLPAGSVAGSPLQVIQSLAAAVGAVVLSDPAGDQIIVRPLHEVSPTAYATTSPDVALTEAKHVFTVDDRYEYRPSYDRIDVLGAGAAVGAADGRTYRWASEDDGEARIVTLSVVPWLESVELTHAGGSHAAIQYHGTRVDEVSEEISVIDGAGSLSGSCLSVVSTDWRYTDLGTVTVAEDGSLTAAIAGDSLLLITYRSRVHVWRMTADVPRVLVTVEADGVAAAAAAGARVTVVRPPGIHEAPAVSEPLISGIVALRERGRNELDESGPRRIVTLEIPMEGDSLIPGMLIEVDSESGPAWRGKLVSNRISAAVGAGPTQTLTVERLA